MKVLFIGGTGVISSACVQQGVDSGMALTVLNRGRTDRPVPPGVRQLKADITRPDRVADLLDAETYDCVVDWIAFTPAQVQRDIELFRGKCGQYIFISSASVYAKPPRLPIRETHPIGNPYWEYARDKVRCEALLQPFQPDFPVTIVRPSHTYDRTKIPLRGGYTALHRLIHGRPVVVHGDGTTAWTLTHHADFARGFLGLIGNRHALGETYHITGDEVLTWNQVYQTMAQAAGVEANLVPVASKTIVAGDPGLGEGLLGDKAHNAVFDNSKIKQAVPGFEAQIPFARGAREILDWYAADPDRQVVDPHLDAVMDRLCERARMT
jgi:nucleoside-diphosphate-sugar epimerase